MLGLRSYLYTKKPNDTVDVTYKVDGETKTVNVVLESKNIQCKKTKNKNEYSRSMPTLIKIVAKNLI